MEHSEHSTDFASIRRSLAQARADLRVAQDAYQLAVLRAERQLIVDAGGSIKNVATNPTEQNRAFAFAVEQDRDCQIEHENLRLAEARVANLEADLEILRDDRRQRELQAAERYIDAFGGTASNTYTRVFTLPHLREPAS